MSKSFEPIEIEKCIVSRLWYTASAILTTELESHHLSNYSLDDIEHLIEIINTVIINYENRNQYEWICYILLFWFDKNNSARTKKKLDFIQFHYNLKLINNEIPEIIEKGLLELFEAILQIKHGDTWCANKIDTKLFKFLETSLYSKPTLTCSLFHDLMQMCPISFFSINLVVRDLYLNVLKLIIKKENINEYLSKLKCILSKLNVTESAENELLDWLYPNLFLICDSEEIELVFYSRKKSKFLKEWHKYFDYKNVRSVVIDNINIAQRISNVIFFTNTDFNEFRLNPKELSLRIIIRGLHWLLEILDMCLMFINNEEYNKISQILSCPILRNIWPSLLLHFLYKLPHVLISTEEEMCQKSIAICESIEFLVNTCYLINNEYNEPILTYLNTCLNRRLTVINWILKHQKKYTNTTIDENFSVKSMLTALKNYCILTVLKKCIDIHECNFEEIANLLIDRDKTMEIFKSYRIMQTAIKAILMYEFYNTRTKESTKNLYSEMESLLNNLNPLNLRLEVIENVFSMLFLRHNVHFNVTEGTSEEEDYATALTEKESETSAYENKELEEHKRCGFICNKYSVKQILGSLKRSTIQLDIDFMKLKEMIEVTKELETLKNNIFNLDNAITDALWRLELLTNLDLVENKYNKQDSVVCLSNLNKTVDEKHFTFRLKSKSVFYNPQTESSSDENKYDQKSDIDGSSETGSIDTNNTNKRQKKNKNQPPTIELVGMAMKDTNLKFVINLMLASKESLVLQCLWKSDYTRAQQVIEVFNMNNTDLDGQVRLSKSMQNFRQEMIKQMNSSDTQSYAVKSEELKIFENVRRAAQGGYWSSRIANQLETFVASQESNARLLCSNAFSTRQILALCVLDIALTMNQSHQYSINLLDIAMKYLKLSYTLESTQHLNHFENVHRLFHEGDLQKSVPAVLCDNRVPLKIQDWREKTNFWQILSNKMHQFQNNWAQLDNLSINIDHKELRTSENLKVIYDIIALCEKTHSYLYKILAHLQILLLIVPVDNETKWRKESILLSNSLKFYFGYQIFDLNNKPENLEIIANKLGVNLVHNILINCCPKLTYFDGLPTVYSETWGCIILNKIFNKKISSDQKNQDPNQCVADILLELIETIKRLYPNYSRILNKDLYNLSKNSAIQRILQKSSQLEFLDLSELSIGEHTLSFFLNLWNLLFLHTQLTVWINNPPLNSLRHFISLSSISYHVGDLGRISLANLRSKLLGSMCWESEYFSHIEDLNEVAWQDLDLVHDPRVIFAMANEFYETPMIQIFYPHSLNKDLNIGLHNYLEHYTTKKSEFCNTDKKNLKEIHFFWIPDIVERYEKFQQKNSSNTDCSKTILDQLYQNIFSFTDYISKTDKIIYQYKPVVSTYEILLKFEDKITNKIDIKTKRNINLYDNSSLLSRSIKSNVLHYLEEHCWLLSYLVKRIYKESSCMLESGCNNLRRTTCFENYSTSLWIITLADVLFNNNTTLATIQENFSLNNLWIYLNKCLQNDQLKNCLDIINALPNRLLIRFTEIQFLKDKLLYQLIHKMEKNSITEKILQYIYQIKDINVLAQTILSNINEWPIYLCQDALFHILQHTDKHKLPSHCTFKINETQCRVSVFYKILPYYKNKELNSKEVTWYDVVHCAEKNDPVYTIQSLIEANKFELCIKWLEYQAFSLEIQSLVTHDLLIGLLKNDETNFKNARKLLIALPTRQSMKICKGVLKKLESIRAMRFIIEYVLEHCEVQKMIIYYKAYIGVEILDQLDSKERVHYVHLIKEPLLMLEQLLMNCKFENLRRIVNIIERSDNFQKAEIPIENFDKIVRFYAGKSLDFRVSLLRDGIDFKIKDTTNFISVLDNENWNSEFIMPITVPTKEKWIPNDKARECNCCKAVIFSMFNRRHHCRRCGRVVCAACSQQRMQVPNYPKSVLVRVCDDCKKQTILQVQAAQGTSSTASSVVLDCWKLTTDETHNKTVREEFSFEYAPNISLCLAILSLHSDHKAYASFLLDRCDDMKKLLQPVTGGRVNPEIDHSLIIKMIRSLLVAVKVKCAKLGLNAGLAHCDRFLSQVDLIATLVQSDCLALIPTDDSLDEHAFRKLRDLLSEKEQWTLALDVCTKSGLDTQGVWAAWGKACLKVGFLDHARTKFTHCLEKLLHENFDDWVLVSYPDTDNNEKNFENSSDIQKQKNIEDIKNDSFNRKRQPIKNRPIKDPPLLVEILQILENQSQLNSEQSQNLLQLNSNTAQEILITLNSLKAISQNQCSFIRNWNSHSIYYKESLYYLLTYGSFNSILEFFVKHEEFTKCLAFILENNVEPELFFNAVYLQCLNMGNIDKLFCALRADDASLLIWKKYLVYTCHSLDKKKFLHTLYHLQLFMKDFIRAAMTCIRFYKNDAKNYTELSFKSHFLVDAQKHLETELNIESLNKKRKKSINSLHNNLYSGLTMEMQASEIDKHMNTISRQLEIVKFLGNAEKEGRFINPYLKHLIDMDTENTHSEELPTLFGNQRQKTRLAVLAILCGRDAEEGFGIAFRIMQDYNLRPQKVYSLAGHVLALEKKIGSIEQLIKCCRSSGAPDSQAISDRVLSHCIKLLLQKSQITSNSDFKDRIDSLIRLINDVELKISSYIEGKQLKAAYLLAVKYQRSQDIKKILKEADRLGQNAIRSICTKWLKQTQNSL